MVANLLTHAGLPMSEPMAFGLASALTFAYLPFVKIGGMPLIAYRMPPGSIIKGVARRLSMRWERRRFRDPGKGTAALNSALDRGRVVGLQTSVYWLPYFPEDMRFHFNAHNLVVYGRSGGDYLISDPVFEDVVRADAASLEQARFAKGVLAAKGALYFPKAVPAEIDYAQVVPQAIRRNLHIMTKAPVPIIGISGIRFLGRSIEKLAKKPDRKRHLELYLGHIVRMQEEIGTGGAGFRFLYASFLQEAGKLLDNALLREAAATLTEAGDEWRNFALQATKMCRGRTPMDGQALRAVLDGCADRERAVWRMLEAV